MMPNRILKVVIEGLILLLFHIFSVFNNKKIIYLKLLLIIHISTSSIAQTPYFKNFTENDGLASSTVYFLLQDSEGFIWFATDAGVSRYNGYTFETFTIKDGLGDNEIFKIFEDSRKRIWFLSYNGKISYWHNGKFYNSTNTHFLKAIDSDSYFSHIMEDKKGNIWLSTEKSGIVSLNTGNMVKRYNSFPFALYLFETTDGNIIGVTHSGIFDVLKNRLIRKSLLFEFRHTFSRTHYMGGDSLLFSSNDQLYIFNYKKLSINKFAKEETFNKITNLCAGEGTKNWICTRFGVYDISSRSIKKYLKEEPVSHVLKDHEGNTWFSTLGNGVYFTPSSGILNYTQKEGLPINECYTLKSDSHDNLWIGQEKGFLTKINKNEIFSYNFLKGALPDRGRIISLCETQKGFWLVADFGIAKFENNKTLNPKGLLGGQKSIIKTGNKLIYGGTYGIFITQEDEIDKLVKIKNIGALPQLKIEEYLLKFAAKPYMAGRTTKLFKDSRDVVWIGMNNGLRTLKDSSITDLCKKYPQLTCRISGIAESSDHTIWIATQGKGIFSLKNQKLIHITEKDGLLSDICNNITVDKDNIIWVATNKGINKMWYSDGKLKLDYFNFNNGIISNQINDICLFENKVWMATPKGLGCFNKNLVKKSTPPITHITNFYVLGENKRYNKKKDYSLRYNENSIKIDYIGISFRHLNTPLLYRYKFDKKDTAWHYTTNISIEFPQLSPGNYEFEVECKNNEGLWSTKASSINFTIQTPFWQTFWFYFALACLFVSIVWLIFSLRFKSLEKKEVLLRTVTESKLKALRAQMDPHFIFNSLMALQNLMRKNIDDADRYVSKFAKLMRLTLDNSRSEYIPLSEEIETLQNYLELQQLRRINLFEYNIYVDPKIDCDDVSIPPMLAQPFIENAIEHGIFNISTKGEINIRFAIVDDLMKVEVEDNGIGMQKSMEMKEEVKKIHKSLATTIIKERLALLNRKKDEKIDLNIEDIKDDLGSIVGTKVAIWVPYLNKYLNEE